MLAGKEGFLGKQAGFQLGLARGARCGEHIRDGRKGDPSGPSVT